MKRVHIVDNFLSDPNLERERALNAGFEITSHRGLDYPGIALTQDEECEARIRSILGLEGGEFTTFFRQYLPTDVQKTFIHNDCQIGVFSGILFLTKPEDAKGGVAFWRHRLYGWEVQPDPAALAPLGLRDTADLWESVHADGLDDFKWEMVDYVPVEFNRLILFASNRYHSRYPKDPDPTHTRETCRLIKTFFWMPSPAVVEKEERQ